MNFLDKEGVAHLWKHIVAKLNSKVETEDGKGLSTNDFTNEEKEKLANMESFVETKISALVDSAPETLNTLNELSAALGDDPNFATTIANQIGGKVDKEEGKGLSSNDFTTEEKEKLASAIISVDSIEANENGEINTTIVIRNDESTGTIDIVRNPELLWLALQNELSGVLIYQRVIPTDNNAQDYLMDNSELTTLIFSATDEVVAEVWRIGFDNKAPDLLIDCIAHTISIDPNWVAPAANVKSVNNILPDENGNVELDIITDAQIDEICGSTIEVASEVEF